MPNAAKASADGALVEVHFNSSSAADGCPTSIFLWRRRANQYLVGIILVSISLLAFSEVKRILLCTPILIY